MFKTKTGGYGFEVMSMEDCRAHAQKYSKSYSQGFSPWYLNSNSDDDGFCDAPRKVMRMCSASDDAMKILIAKKFVLSFTKNDSFIVVIKHWRMHNTVRKDTYHETKYKELLRELYYDENNSYSLSPDGHRPVLPECAETVSQDSIPEPVTDPLRTRDESVNEPATQIRLDKNRLDKNSQILTGSDPDVWGTQIEDYIHKEIRNGKDVLIPTTDGDVITISADTEGKSSFRNEVKDDTTKKFRKQTDQEYETKLNAEAHIDEIVSISKRGNRNVPDYNGIHGDKALYGFNYRTAFFRDFDGKYYRLTISVMEGTHGKLAYNIGEISERSFPKVSGSSANSGARSGKTSFATNNNTFQNNSQGNNPHSAREVSYTDINESVDDIISQTGKDVGIRNESNAQFSLRTFEEGGRAQLETFLNDRVASGAITETEKTEMLDQMNLMYDICKKYADTYTLFGEWSRAEVVTDPETGNAVFSVVKANGEYAMNLDFSLVCKKRRTLDAVFNQMIEDGIMEDFEMREGSIAAINDIIRDNGFETACALCFVDAKRYRQALVADSFVRLYNPLVRSLAKQGQTIDAFNFGGNSKVENTGAGIDTLPDSELDFSRIDEILRTVDSGKVLYKIAKNLKENPSDRKLVARGDFMSTAGFDNINATNKRILSLYNSKKGAGGPKASQSDVQYLNDILSNKKFSTEAAYSVGGVRIQSFSDYVPRLVFDYLQMIADLQAKNLPAHAYTKEPMFALQFGMMGIKTNMSLVPEVVEGGVAPGLDANGNYAWRDGQSFGSTVYDGSKAFIEKCYEIIGKKYTGQSRLTAQEGFELAKAIQRTEGYSQNCGTIAVGVSYEHIMKMLDDPDIRMIIPYHKSSLNHIVAVMTNIDKYHDYTSEQNTRKMENGKLVKLAKGEDTFNFNETLRELGDAKAAADAYLSWCRENGYTPKFKDFAWHENYYKLLEDFTCYDESGAAAPQETVKIALPGADSPFGSMQEMIRMGLEEDAILQGKQDAMVPEIVKQIKTTLPTLEEEMKASKSKKGSKNAAQDGKRSQRDYSYDALVSKPAMKLTTVTEKNSYIRSDVYEAGLNNAKMYGRATGNGSGVAVYVADISDEVIFNQRILKHGNDRRIKSQAPVIEKIGEILSNSIKINELVPRDINIEETYILVGAAQTVAGQKYIATFVVNRSSNEVESFNILYAENAKKESAASRPTVTGNPASLTDSEIRISDLIDIVKDLYPDILPEDVLRHYGFDKRPEGKLGESALFSQRDISAMAQTAEEHFGITNNANESGYITVNGKYLDFSGRHWGGNNRNSREVDHADVAEILPEDFDTYAVIKAGAHKGEQNRSGLMAILEFEKYGMIRTQPETGSIELTMAPTEAQQKKLKEYFSAMKSKHGKITVSLNDLNSEGRIYPAAALHYGVTDSSDAIILDILEYYNRGNLPEGVKAFDKSVQNSWMFSARDFGLEDLNKFSKDAIEKRGGIIVNNDSDLLYHIQKTEGNNDKQVIYFGGIDESIIDTLEKEVGISLRKHPGQYVYGMTYDALRHIAKHFAEPERRIEAIHTVIGIVKNHTAARYYSKGDQKRIEMEARINNRDYLSVTIAATNKRILETVTVFISKTYDDLGKKNGNDFPSGVTQGDDLGGSASTKNISYDNNGSQDKSSLRETSSVRDLDRRIIELQQEATEIRNRGWSAEERVKADPRVQAAQQEMWRLEDEGNRIRGRVEYRKAYKAVFDEMYPGGIDTDTSKIDAEIASLQEQRDLLYSIPSISDSDYKKLKAHYGVTEDYGKAGYADKMNDKLLALRASKDAQIAAAKQTGKEKLDTLRAEKNAKINEVRQKGIERAQEAVAKERAKKYEKVDQLRKHYQEMQRRASTRRKSAETRGKIQSLIDDFNRRLSHPTEKRYVPADLVMAAVDMLESIDTDTGRSVKLKEKLAVIQSVYDNLKNDTSFQGYSYDPVVADMLKSLKEFVGDTPLNKMTPIQLEAVYNTLRSLNKVVTDAVKVRIQGEERNAFEVSRDMTKETLAARGVKNKAISKLGNRYINTTLRADVMFNRLAGYKKDSTWSKVARMLNDGQLQSTQVQMELARIFEELVTDKKSLQAMTDTKNMVDIGLKDENGNAILVTRDFMLFTYMNLFNDDNIRHIISFPSASS